MTSVLPVNENNYKYFISMLPDYIMDITRSDEDILLYGIVYDEAAVGTIAVRITGAAAEIFWYLVHPDFRSRFIGRESFFVFLSTLHDRFSVRWVFANIPADADENLYRLFEPYKTEYEILPECNLNTTAGAFMNSPRLRGEIKNSVALSEVNEKDLKIFCNKIVATGQALVSMPIDPAEYYSPASAVFMEDGEATAALLVKKTGDYLEIPYMVSMSKNPAAILDMICFVKKKLARYREDFPVIINLVDEKLCKAVKLMLGLTGEEKDFFKYNKRARIDLSVIDDIRRDTRDLFDIFAEVKSL